MVLHWLYKKCDHVTVEFMKTFFLLVEENTKYYEYGYFQYLTTKSIATSLLVR